MRILLVRHGRSAHVHAGWLSREEFLRWREAYEAAGIHENEVPPAELREVAKSVAVILASNAPRAIATAKMLAPEREIVIDARLRELELAPPHLPLRMPWTMWALAFVVRSLLGRSHASAEEHARAREAAAMLDALARREGDLLVATHGSMRILLAKSLRQMGWQHDAQKRTSRHWSAWTLTA